MATVKQKKHDPFLPSKKFLAFYWMFFLFGLSICFFLIHTFFLKLAKLFNFILIYETIVPPSYLWESIFIDLLLPLQSSILSFFYLRQYLPNDFDIKRPVIKIGCLRLPDKKSKNRHCTFTRLVKGIMQRSPDKPLTFRVQNPGTFRQKKALCCSFLYAPA